MTDAARISYTNDGLEIHFENGRKYDVYPNGEGGVTCKLIEGTLELHPFARTANGVLEDGVEEELEKCADIYFRKKGR